MAFIIHFVYAREDFLFITLLKSVKITIDVIFFILGLALSSSIMSKITIR